jgi:hypothetical protein
MHRPNRITRLFIALFALCCIFTLTSCDNRPEPMSSYDAMTAHQDHVNTYHSTPQGDPCGTGGGTDLCRNFADNRTVYLPDTVLNNFQALRRFVDAAAGTDLEVYFYDSNYHVDEEDIEALSSTATKVMTLPIMPDVSVHQHTHSGADQCDAVMDLTSREVYCEKIGVAYQLTYYNEDQFHFVFMGGLRDRLIEILCRSGEAVIERRIGVETVTYSCSDRVKLGGY